MDDFDARLESLKTALAAALPLRHVTRSLLDPMVIGDTDLTAGVLAIVSGGAGRFTNLPRRIGKDGRQRLGLVMQLRVTEANPPTPKDIETAELVFVGQVVDAIAAVPALGGIDIIDFNQSRQLDYPYGWAALELEWCFP